MGFVIHFCHHKFDLKSITVEPVMFLYMFTIFTNFTTFQALIYDKVCWERFNDTVCNNLKNATTYKEQENIVQKTSSHWILYSNLAFGIPSMVTVIFLFGPLGDTVGKKIPVICPLIGACLAGIINIINSVYFEAPLKYLLIGNVLNGVLGGYVTALMSMYSYIAHVSSAQLRTVRMGILEAMIFLSATLGTATSGIMLDKTSYVFVFALLTGIMAVSILYAVFWLEKLKPEATGEERGHRSCISFVLDALKDTFVCIYTNRKTKHFWHIFLLMLMIFSLNMVTAGEMDIILIFTRHPPLSWSQTTLGLYKGTESFLRGLAILTLLPLIKKRLHVRDSVVIILGLVSRIVSLIVLGTGTTTTILFAGTVFSALQGFSAAAVRSISSRLVTQNDQSKMFSVMAMFESVSSLVATGLFNTVYNATLSLYDGFSFLMAAGIICCLIPIAVYLHVKLQPELNLKYVSLQEETQEVARDNQQTLDSSDII